MEIEIILRSVNRFLVAILNRIIRAVILNRIEAFFEQNLITRRDLNASEREVGERAPGGVDRMARRAALEGCLEEEDNHFEAEYLNSNYCYYNNVIRYAFCLLASSALL